MSIFNPLEITNIIFLIKKTYDEGYWTYIWKETNILYIFFFIFLYITLDLESRSRKCLLDQRSATDSPRIVGGLWSNFNDPQKIEIGII